MKVHSIRITSPNGEVKLKITEPLGSPQAMLLTLHGGPGGDMHGPAGIFDEISEIGAASGYVCCQFDMFGAGGSDGTPADISISTQIQDYRAVRGYLLNRYNLPLVAIGESMGATIVAMDWQSEIGAYMLLWPAFDLRDTDLAPYLDRSWEDVLEAEGVIVDGGIVIGKQFYSQLKTANFDSCFVIPPKPVLIVHGKGDGAVPFEQSVSALSLARGQVTFFAHPTADHGFIGEARESALLQIRHWLEDRLTSP